MTGGGKVSGRAGKRASEEAKKARAQKRAERDSLRARRQEENRAESARRQEEKLKNAESLAAIRKERADRRKKVCAKVAAALKNDGAVFEKGDGGFVPAVRLDIRGDGHGAVAMLAAGGITVRDLACDGGKTSVKLRKKDIRKAIAILDGMCYNYQIGATYGAGQTARKFLARSGLFVGAALSVCALCVGYSRIWHVEISGNDRLSSEVILSALAMSGIAPGSKKSTLDMREVAAAVSGMAGIADASAEIAGTTLYIGVLESEEHSVREVYGGYRSEFDATVTRVVMRSGLSRVKPGDVVKRGDILADGRTYSAAGELLFVGQCDGEVYGNVSVTYSVSVSPQAVEYRRTGQVARRTSFTVFGKTLFLPTPPFESYESAVATANYDLMLPLYVTSYTYYETAPVTVERDIEGEARAFAVQKLSELGAEGLKADCSVKQGLSGMYTVHVFLSGETVISRGCAAAPLPEEKADR